MKTFGIIVAVLGLAGIAQGGELLCNKKQTRCVIEDNTDYTIGDRIGFFNASDELVARGKVKSMRGDRRAITIGKRHGKIKRNDRIALLETRNGASVRDTYKIYRKPADLTIGGGLGLATVGIGGGSPATEFAGYAQWRKWREVEFSARGTFLAMEGEVSRTYDAIETQPMSLSGYGLSGGVGYTLRKNKTLGFRGELGLGLMYIDANVGGDPELVAAEHDFQSQVENGFGPYSRATIGAVLNFNAVHVNFDVTQSLIHEALASTLGAGLAIDIQSALD